MRHFWEDMVYDSVNKNSDNITNYVIDNTDYSSLTTNAKSATKNPKDNDKSGTLDLHSSIVKQNDTVSSADVAMKKSETADAIADASFVDKQSEQNKLIDFYKNKHQIKFRQKTSYDGQIIDPLYTVIIDPQTFEPIVVERDQNIILFAVKNSFVLGSRTYQSVMNWESKIGLMYEDYVEQGNDYLQDTFNEKATQSPEARSIETQQAVIQDLKNTPDNPPSPQAFADNVVSELPADNKILEVIPGTDNVKKMELLQEFKNLLKDLSKAYATKPTTVAQLGNTLDLANEVSKLSPDLQQIANTAFADGVEKSTGRGGAVKELLENYKQVDDAYKKLYQNNDFRLVVPSNLNLENPKLDQAVDDYNKAVDELTKNIEIHNQLVNQQYPIDNIGKINNARTLEINTSNNQVKKSIDKVERLFPNISDEIRATKVLDVSKARQIRIKIETINTELNKIDNTTKKNIYKNLNSKLYDDLINTLKYMTTINKNLANDTIFMNVYNNIESNKSKIEAGTMNSRSLREYADYIDKIDNVDNVDGASRLKNAASVELHAVANIQEISERAASIEKQTGAIVDMDIDKELDFIDDCHKVIDEIDTVKLEKYIDNVNNLTNTKNQLTQVEQDLETAKRQNPDYIDNIKQLEEKKKSLKNVEEELVQNLENVDILVDIDKTKTSPTELIPIPERPPDIPGTSEVIPGKQISIIEQVDIINKSSQNLRDASTAANKLRKIAIIALANSTIATTICKRLSILTIGYKAMSKIAQTLRKPGDIVVKKGTKLFKYYINGVNQSKQIIKKVGTSAKIIQKLQGSSILGSFLGSMVIVEFWAMIGEIIMRFLIYGILYWIINTLTEGNYFISLQPFVDIKAGKGPVQKGFGVFFFNTDVLLVALKSNAKTKPLIGFFDLFKEIVNVPKFDQKTLAVLKSRKSRREENDIPVRWVEKTFELDKVTEAYRTIPFRVSNDEVRKIFLKIDKIQEHFIKGFSGQHWMLYVGLNLLYNSVEAIKRDKRIQNL